MLLLSHSSDEWIPLCVKLVVTVIPSEPPDVSVMGKEDVQPHGLEEVCGVEGLVQVSSAFVMAILYWMIRVSCRWLFLAM